MQNSKNIEVQSDKLLKKINEFVYTTMGLYFPENRWSDLESKFHLASLKLGFKDNASCLAALKSEPVNKYTTETLASYLTIGETSFFRNREVFSALENDVLPEIIEKNRYSGKRIRIWCAACSTGEEPLSIAILLQKILPDIRDWDCSILATDINPKSLAKTKDGIYREWSFRGTPEWVKQTYFSRTIEGNYKILPAIHRMVNFEYHNLTEDIYPSLINSTNALDLVFCRNVLMYFQHEKAKSVVNHFYKSILDGGWLAVGGSEGSILEGSGFVMKKLSDSIIYKKGGIRGDEMKQKPLELNIQPTKRKTRSKQKLTGKSSTTLEIKSVLPASQKITPIEEALKMYKAGEFAELESKLKIILSGNEKNQQALSLLVKTLSNQGKFEEAVSTCESLLLIDKMNEASHYMKALLYKEMGLCEESLKSLKDTIYLNHTFVMAHYSLGNLMLKRGKKELAFKSFNNCLSLLKAYEEEEILPESEELTPGSLQRIITSISGLELNENKR